MVGYFIKLIGKAFNYENHRCKYNENIRIICLKCV